MFNCFMCGQKVDYLIKDRWCNLCYNIYLTNSKGEKITRKEKIDLENRRKNSVYYKDNTTIITKIMKCINNNSWEDCLTIGKIYEVKIEQWDNYVMYYLNDDNDEPINTHLNLFDDVNYIFKQYKTIEEMLELTKRIGTPSRGIEDKNIVAEMEVGNLSIDLNINFDEEGNRHIDYWIAVKDELGDWVEGNYLIESPILDENIEKNMFETLIQYAKENNYIY